MMNKVQSVMAKRAAGEKGFTLVELLVVVVILVVLAAIAVPIFLNQKTKAESSTAQTNVANVAGALATGKATGLQASLSDGKLTVGSDNASAGKIDVNVATGTVVKVPSTTLLTTAVDITSFCVSQPQTPGSTTPFWKMTDADSAPQSAATAC